MINPCDTCIVDVMCSKPCGKFVGFMKEFALYPSWFKCRLNKVVATQARFERAIKFAEFYTNEGLYSRLRTYYKYQQFERN